MTWLQAFDLMLAATRDGHGHLAGRARMIDELLTHFRRRVPWSDALHTLLDVREDGRVTASLARVTAAGQRLAAGL